MTADKKASAELSVWGSCATTLYCVGLDVHHHRASETRVTTLTQTCRQHRPSDKRPGRLDVTGTFNPRKDLDSGWKD